MLYSPNCRSETARQEEDEMLYQWRGICEFCGKNPDTVKICVSTIDGFERELCRQCATDSTYTYPADTILETPSEKEEEEKDIRSFSVAVWYVGDHRFVGTIETYNTVSEAMEAEAHAILKEQGIAYDDIRYYADTRNVTAFSGLDVILSMTLIQPDSAYLPNMLADTMHTRSGGTSSAYFGNDNRRLS